MRSWWNTTRLVSPARCGFTWGTFDARSCAHLPTSTTET